MMTVKQAASTGRYREARRNGAGVTEAIASARWSQALHNSVMQTMRDSERRSKAARRGWKTRKANA